MQDDDERPPYSRQRASGCCPCSFPIGHRHDRQVAAKPDCPKPAPGLTPPLPAATSPAPSPLLRGKRPDARPYAGRKPTPRRSATICGPSAQIPTDFCKVRKRSRRCSRISARMPNLSHTTDKMAEPGRWHADCLWSGVNPLQIITILKIYHYGNKHELPQHPAGG